MVALTGIEPDGCEFRPVQLGLSRCVFSAVGASRQAIIDGGNSTLRGSSVRVFLNTKLGQDAGTLLFESGDGDAGKRHLHS